MILYPNAKINIGLDILRKRNDGFHELETIMYPIGLSDILTINFSENAKEKINLTTTGIKIDGNSNDNLIMKAFELINKTHKLPALDIHLHKSIPFGAGLGGGSADCAFTISGINSLCDLKLTTYEMEAFAAELGSDCPFFIQNKPALAKGRGEQLQLIDVNLSKYYFAVVIPPFPISTRQAYSLVKPIEPSIKLEQSIGDDISNWRQTIKNDFEISVFTKFPQIEQAKKNLYSQGAIYAALSGSGSAVFGIFNEQPNLSKVFPKDYFIWCS